MEGEVLQLKLWKKLKADIKIQEETIKKEWLNQWEKEGKEGEVFCDWLQTTFDEIQYKIGKNKKYNIITKFIYMLYLIVSFFAVTVYIFMSTRKDAFFVINSNNIYSVILIVVFWLISTSFISKWLLIKKYQETLSRLTGFKGLILSAMLKYLYSISPYDKNNKKEVFIINILKYAQGNIEKFQTNMENKETKFLDLSDILNNINIKSKE